MSFISLFASIVSTSVLLTPQAVISPVATVQLSNNSTNARWLDRQVTIELSQVPLRDALVEVSRQVGIKLAFGMDVVPLNTRVSLKASNISARAAFSRLLKGMGAHVEVSPAGQGVIVRDSKSAVSSQGVIAGKVKDAKTGNGVSGATISVNPDNREVVSGNDGSYRITGVSNGARTVSVRLVGYARQTRSVTVGEGVTTTLDFALEPSASVLDQVIVTGTVAKTELRAVPSAISVITAKQLEERGITRIDQLFRGDIPGLFSLEQGTFSASGNGSVDGVIMFSRGATKISTLTNTSAAASITNPIKTYVDGVEMADAQYLSQIDPKSIERIEILTGPQASTIYGDGAINGVMQIFTKRGAGLKPTITFSALEGLAQSQYSNARTPMHQYDGGVTGTEGRFSYNAGGGWNYTGAWSPGKQMQRTSVYSGGRYQSGPFSADVSARQGWTRNNVQGFVFQVGVSLGETGKALRTSGYTAPRKARLSGSTYGATLGYAPYSWWSHQVTVGTDKSDSDLLGLSASLARQVDTNYSNSQNPSSKASQSYSSTLRLPLLSTSQLTLTYGADHWRTKSSLISWDVSPSGSIVNPSVTRNKPSKNSGAFVQGQLGITDALFVTYGVRADWNPNYGEDARVLPGRYGVSYAKDFGTLSAKVRGSYGRSIRPPGDGQIQGTLDITADRIAVFGPYYTTLPSPQLGPEFQEGGEGGLELYIGNRGSLVITRFNQTVDGLISSVGPVDSVRALQPGLIGVNGSLCFVATDLRSDGYCYRTQSQFLNVGSIRNQGWETQGSINVGPFTTSGVYSWTKSRVIGITPRYRYLFTNTAFSPGQTFNFVPEHTWAMNVGYSRQGTSVLLNVTGLGTIYRNGTDSDIASLIAIIRLPATDAYRASNPTGYRQAQAGYAITNLNASHRLSERLEASLQVNNLTNFYQNDTHLLSSTLGRQTRLGARLRF